jgi:Protein kinase domain/PEGA domain
MSTNTLRISHYRVEYELKRDSLGYFFRAIDEQLDRTVVLRVVRANLVLFGSRLAETRARIREGAKAVARLSHPNLTTIYEYRSLAETDMVVMEFAEGETLEAARLAGRRWTVLEVARLMAQMADALAAAHDAGLVHGNVTPVNIRIRPDGRAKLLDLGVAKKDLLEGRIPHDAADDVRGLARVGYELLAPAQTEAPPPGMRRRDPLADPTAGRAQFGFLAPVLTSALYDPVGYESALAFRDAVLIAIETATGRSARGPELEGAFATQFAGPDAAPTDVEISTDLQTLIPVGRTSASQRPPRLVLPPDLAGRAPAESAGMLDVRPVQRTPPWAVALVERALQRIGPSVTIAILLGLSLGLATWLVVRRSGKGEPVSAELVGTTPDSVADTTAAANAGVSEGDPQVAPETAQPTPPAASTPASFEAVVRAGPPGAVIRSRSTGQTWTNQADLSVVAGDSLPLEFSRPGYVTQRHVFTGSRIAVELDPDSVVARFSANIPAEVYLLDQGTPQRLGTTDLSLRLPSGTHRVVFRSLGQPDWDTTVAMTRPGVGYAVVKQDYRTVGSFIATVAGTWALVSVDGGSSRETPARFDSLAVGRHVISVSRPGFSTVVDTVLVQPGGVLRRQYTVR